MSAHLTAEGLRLAGLCVRYPKARENTLADLSCHIPRGQFTVLLGPSGAGKSTLLRALLGLTPLTQGQIQKDSVPQSPKALRDNRRRTGMVHQRFHLVQRLSAFDNVLTGALPDLTRWQTLTGLISADWKARILAALEEVGIDPEQHHRRASQLSGGQQQRVAIARALLREPELLLADEPIASLDPETSRRVMELLRTAAKKRGTTVLCSLHQVEVGLAFADHLIALKGGRVHFEGSPSDIEPAQVATLYAEAEA